MYWDIKVSSHVTLLNYYLPSLSLFCLTVCFPFIILPYCLLPFHYSALLSASLSLFCPIVCFQFIPPAYCLSPRDRTASCYCLSTIPRLCLIVFCANHRSMLLSSSTVSFLCALHHLSNFVTIRAIYRQPRQAC